MKVEAQILQGRWWIAGKPKTRVNGTLEIEQSGSTKITLFPNDEIDSNNFFNFEEAKIGGRPFKFSRLVGLLHNGKVVTADNVSCFFSGMQNLVILEYDCYPAYICISSIDFEKDDLKLSNISLEIDGLDEFIFVSGFKYKQNIKADAQNKLTGAVFEPTYSHPDRVQIFHENGVSLYAHFGFKYSPGFSELAIKQTTKFRLESEIPMSLSDWWDEIISLNQIVCILFGQPLPLISIQSSYKLNGKEETLDFISYSEPNPKRHIKPFSSNLLFKRSEEKDITDKLLKEFLKLRKEYHLIFDAFFSSKFTDNQYASTRFFMITKALEGFHRLLRCNNNKNRKSISLKTRIDELFADFEEISNCEYQWGDIATKVASYRNQEAHLMKTSQNYDVNDIHKITQTLHVVFAILFLAEATKRANCIVPAEWLKRSSWISQNLPVLK
ncbi:ApeA N-terminal domain 1-containing protein [Candidatus Puniceispirillum marinum]|uniref:Uncharacterized protein n=1 Tax=Puniceispirillum marinum (strain IMCC1322) TaxID=488538 RepID=D5BQE9_PUNMI|nr:HEPN domain-containing protein [Candidatus Puniceispirillum marinum]ADE40667.1 hypothetical protein SAR116_2424 [Candidatus Puniceispirillum marinum IMCC1322]